MENLSLHKSRVLRSHSPAAERFGPKQISLPPIAGRRRASGAQILPPQSENELTTITELGGGRTRSRLHGHTTDSLFQEMKSRAAHESALDFLETPPRQSAGFVFGNPVPPRQSVLRQSRRQSSAASKQPPSKMISLDIGELKRTVDDNEGFNPSRLRGAAPPSGRNQTSRRSRRPPRPQPEQNSSSDIFARETPRGEVMPPPGFLSSASTTRLHRSLAEHELRQNKRGGGMPSVDKSSRSEPDIKKVMEDQLNGNLGFTNACDTSVPFAKSSSVQSLKPFSIPDHGAAGSDSVYVSSSLSNNRNEVYCVRFA